MTKIFIPPILDGYVSLSVITEGELNQLPTPYATKTYYVKPKLSIVHLFRKKSSVPHIYEPAPIWSTEKWLLINGKLNMNFGGRRENTTQ